MKSRLRFGLVLVAMLIASGCLKYTYSVAKVKPDLGPTGNGTVAVASQDLRSYVVSGKNEPQLVGVIRATFGNPVYMTTASGKPLSEEMSNSIVTALNKKGFKATPVAVSPTDPFDQVHKKLQDTGAKKLIHFQIKKWKSDTYNRVRLEYILKLAVMDGRGMSLAEKEITGDDNLGGAGMNTLSGTRKKVPKAFKEKMEELFNTPDIVKALES